MDQQYFGVSLEKLLTSGGQTLYMVAWSLIIGTIMIRQIVYICRKLHTTSITSHNHI